MFRKNISFRPIFFKVFFTYLMVYVLALIFKYTYDIESIISNIQHKYLIALNIITIFLGLPLSFVFDFILLKFFGLYYVLFFPPVLNNKCISSVFIEKIQIQIFKKYFVFERQKISNLINF